MKRERKPLHFAGYDNNRPGFYYIALCAHRRRCFFGEIFEDNMMLSDPGKMVKSILINIPEFFNNMYMDCFVVMPNHIHAVVVITEESSKISGEWDDTGAVPYTVVGKLVERK